MQVNRVELNQAPESLRTRGNLAGLRRQVWDKIHNMDFLTAGLVRHRQDLQAEPKHRPFDQINATYFLT